MLLLLFQLNLGDGASPEVPTEEIVRVTRHPIRRMRQAPTPLSEEWVTAPLFRLDLEVGVGTGSSPDPQVMLRWSDNRGETFGPEHWRSAGRQGEYRRRARWQRLGRFRLERVFQLVISDPVRVRLIDASIET